MSSDLVPYRDLAPEIRQYDLPLHTLSDLGYRRSAQALKAGYICVRKLELYRWFAYHWPDFFPEVDRATEAIAQVNRYISRSIADSALYCTCRECGRRLPANFRYPVCDSCYRSDWWGDCRVVALP